jgi:hypothetical protein
MKGWIGLETVFFEEKRVFIVFSDVRITDASAANHGFHSGLAPL